eukprot:832525-Alexandrium_andersonii.AAC.1
MELELELADGQSVSSPPPPAAPAPTSFADEVAELPAEPAAEPEELVADDGVVVLPPLHVDSGPAAAGSAAATPLATPLGSPGLRCPTR